MGEIFNIESQVSEYVLDVTLVDIKDIYIISDFFLHELGDQKYLKDTKNKIETIDPCIWNKIRKYINTYESPYKTKFDKKSKLITPISRAYYKLQEILIDNDIRCIGKSFHIAESPGGFIQSVLEIRKKKMYKGKCITVSLLPSDCKETSVPVYPKYLYEHKYVDIIKGKNKNWNGNIMILSDFLEILKYMKNEVISIVTADGGINDNGLFNNKEISHINLIFCEIVLALFTLNEHGTFILKIFDIYTKATRDFILLLSMLFDNVIITKPLTSRPTNSEKYIICKNYKKEKFSTEMKNTFIKTIFMLKNTTIVSKLFQDMPDYNIINKCILNVNNKTCLTQTESIKTTLDFITKNKFTNVYIDYSRYTNFNLKKEFLNDKWIKKYS